jgi:2'-5' RNA ligase
VRLFIAIPLPPDVAASAASALPDLPGIRLVHPELMHVTLAFLGATPEERLADVVAAVSEAASGQARFAASLEGIGRFPPTGVPRIVWLGIGAGATEAGNLAILVRRALASREIPFDGKAFRPHLTLGRVKENADRPTARAIAAASERVRLPPLRFDVGELLIFESVLSPKGARYTARAAVPLRAGGVG